MDEEVLRAHWDRRYAHQDPEQLAWYQAVPDPSLDLIEETDCTPKSPVIDVGGGASTLVDVLWARGYRDLTVLDLSAKALKLAQGRLGLHAGDVTWIQGDVTALIPEQHYRLWHDRAVFHFLTDPVDRALYAAVLSEAMEPGGWVIIGTFAPDGPTQCSGLPVVRYDTASLHAEIGPEFEAVTDRRQVHVTPGGTEQRYNWSLFRRL